MPTESPPTPSQKRLARPPDDHPHDAWGLGADLEPGTLLAAYRAGLFPMRVESDLIWWSPVRRAVIPVAGFSVSRSLGQPPDVVRQPDHEQEQYEPDADDRDALVDPTADRATADTLDDREDDVPSVERQQWQ